MKRWFFDPSKLYECKCKKCGVMFKTSAPSRIEDPMCAKCLITEKKKSKRIGLPKDFAKVQVELRKEFGKCRCSRPLIPLQSFKVNETMYCEGCYRNIMESRWKSGCKESKDFSVVVNEDTKESRIDNLIQENGLRPTQEV